MWNTQDKHRLEVRDHICQPCDRIFPPPSLSFIGETLINCKLSEDSSGKDLTLSPFSKVDRSWWVFSIGVRDQSCMMSDELVIKSKNGKGT